MGTGLGLTLASTMTSEVYVLGLLSGLTYLQEPCDWYLSPLCGSFRRYALFRLG